MTIKRIDTEKRFWGKVKKTSRCWKFKSGKRRYGRIRVHENGKWSEEQAHRFSWRIHNGEIPNNLWVLHKCDNGICVNPKHLFLGNSDDNIKDMLNKRRNVRGENVGTSKLKENQVREIKSRYVRYSRVFNHRFFAEKFGVSVSAIHWIIKNKMWKHI